MESYVLLMATAAFEVELRAIKGRTVAYEKHGVGREFSEIYFEITCEHNRILCQYPGSDALCISLSRFAFHELEPICTIPLLVLLHPPAATTRAKIRT